MRSCHQNSTAPARNTPLKTDPSEGQQERRSKPISRQEQELTKALDFLVENLQMHGEEYHHTTDERQVKRYESILEEAISELIARKERDAGQAAQPGGGDTFVAVDPLPMEGPFQLLEML